MRLTLKALEDVFLHSEKELKICPAAWSLLYFAARNDGIDKLEALRVIRRDSYETSLFIEAFLDASDLEEVKKLIFLVGLDKRSFDSDVLVAKRMLESWVAKTVMRQIANRSATARLEAGEDAS